MESKHGKKALLAAFVVVLELEITEKKTAD